MRPVKTKKDFVARYQQGEFGNAGPTWNDVPAFCRAVKRNTSGKLYHLRNRVTAGETYYNLTRSQLINKWSELGENLNWYVSEMAPTESTIIQGEIQHIVPQSPDMRAELCLRYTTIRRPMREALSLWQRHITNTRALKILELSMDTCSYDWMHILLERYPYHVLEFSVYNQPYGTIPYLNTIWWEVRDY